ncbi:rCG44451, partial [Rattus norvegicus]
MVKMFCTLMIFFSVTAPFMIGRGGRVNLGPYRRTCLDLLSSAHTPHSLKPFHLMVSNQSTCMVV